LPNELISSLIQELNIKYMANLADPALDELNVSDPDSENDDETAHLIFVGGSHAARMAAAADRLGLSYTDLARPGLRITEFSRARLLNYVRLLRPLQAAEPSWGIIFLITTYTLQRAMTAPDSYL
jgi:hypothetical protein